MTIDIQQEEARAKDLVARANANRFDSGGLAELRTEYGRFAKRITEWAEERLEEAKADGRDRLHADDDRKQLKLRALLGDVQGAMGEAIARDASTIADRVRAGGETSTEGSKAAPIRFPSLREYRDLESKAMSIGSDPGGGYLVMPQSGPFFDRMRARNVVLSAGPIVVDMTSDAIEVPFLAGSTTVYTPGEAGTLTESDATIAKGRIPAIKYSVRTVCSSELLADSNPSAREILSNDHQLQLANRLDLDWLQANGGGTRVGLRRTPEATVTELGAGNGAAPTLNDIANALFRLESDNADMDRVVLFMAPRVWNSLRLIDDLQERYQLQPDPTKEARRSLFGHPVFVSPQISVTETVGSSSDCSYILAVDMSKVVVGRRLDVGVLIDPYSKSGTDQVVLQTISRWGMGVIYPAAVEIVTGVRS